MDRESKKPIVADHLLLDREIAEMTNAGAFGPDVRYVSFVLDSRHNVPDQFASTVVYGTVAVATDDGNEDGIIRRRLVIKLKHRHPELREFFKTDLHFSNETMFYERIVPFMRELVHADGVEESVPSLARYFYGRNECGDQSYRDMMVLENVNVRGYRSAQCDDRLHLDLDHAIVALKALAKFHGISYRAKHLNRTKFEEIVAKISETQWDADGEWYTPEDGIRELFKPILERLAERYGDKNDERLRRFRTELLSDAKRVLWCVYQPVEPVAVLCHGDFNRNNIMFRYDDDSDRPVDAMAFDLATIRYGSPALDLSFFLYMNTEQRLRGAHWDELLNAYCAALNEAVGDIAVTVPVPDRVQIDAEMRQYAFYGLVHVSFFVRMMMEQSKSLDPWQWSTGPIDELVTLVLSYGGDKATETIADAVQHFIDIRYADIPFST